MSPALRRAGPADAATIAERTLAAYAKWVERLGRRPRPMNVDYVEAILKHRFDVAPVEGEIVAALETTPQDGWLLIVNIAVRPDAQGQGLAGALLDQALAREGGLAGLRLYANKLMSDNLAFCARRGFVVARVENYPGDEVVHMERALAR